ncbi:MAG: NADH-quinone oxidoreductase subunit NuoE family protein, partial [Alphaproteobacteria bacterium]
MSTGKTKGVWKSGKGKGRHTPKGRQLDDAALVEVQELLGARPRSHDLLIEHLHLIQDHYGHLPAVHLRALGEEMGMAMAEVYEVASFYAHFDIVKEGETAPPALTIRVCESLSCEMAGAEQLLNDLASKYSSSEVRVLRAPCMGRCDTAPVLELGHNHIDHANLTKVDSAITAQDFNPNIPDYEGFDAYVASGGGMVALAVHTGELSGDAVQNKLTEAGLRG